MRKNRLKIKFLGRLDKLHLNTKLIIRRGYKNCTARESKLESTLNRKDPKLDIVIPLNM